MSSPQPLDVCLVAHPYTARKDVGAGHDRYAYELSVRLHGAGCRVEIFDSGPLQTIAQAAVAEVGAVVRLLRHRRPRVYHATATMNAMAPLTARKHPLVTSILDVLWFFVDDRYRSPLKYRLKSFGMGRAVRGSDALIVPFPSQRDFLVDELGARSERIHVVSLGIDHDQFCPPGAGEIVQRATFMPTDSKNVLFVGALNLGKGIDTLIRCFDRVVRAVPDARLIVGSKGWDTPIVRAIWEKSPVKERILFVGFIPEADLRAAYIHADVTCFPSRYGFGLPIAESMACGTPTVSGRVLDAPEFVGDAGLMANPNDPEELAAQLAKLLGDDALHAEYRQRGLRRAAQFTWEACATRTAEVYRTVA
jgi:glycosyltransferase involved in cell wall biosynthesis